MILLIDNYDSFVFNLARYVRELGREVMVIRNDAIDAAAIRTLAPEAVILSPGPCAPDQAGQCLNIVRDCSADFPILGVCLGHQVIAQVFGGRIARAKRPLHGKTTPITHNATGLFKGLPSPLTVTRYHSLIAELPAGSSPLEITAQSPDGEVMALAHQNLPVHAVQFHPEAVLTEHGHDLLANFLGIADAFNAAKPDDDEGRIAITRAGV
ncbi:anthranilate synthase component II [Thalassospira marina]|uniref:Aminodeoxychorismate/anthranilate synthase component II n=1 Tax=Thalassospira marina TaxID=2048283 RepID=A0A2N3KUW6_9PROT|nr:aminodeoxychorismate/anthranilate synthase component II [Thalassospira marina]PKR54328.1 aminodeoxychorismate/anthranilate synthase component II [Thalassospira marina]